MEEGRYFINGLDAFTTYGLVFASGTYSELLTLPKKKPVLTKDWPDQNGTQRLFPVTPFFESITYTIPVYHTGTGETDFYSKYAAWTTFLQSTNYFNFDVVEMNRRFVLLYENMPSFDKLTLIKGAEKVYCKSTISFINDYPILNVSPAQDVLNKFVAKVAADGGTYDFGLLSLLFNEGSLTTAPIIEPIIPPVNSNIWVDANNWNDSLVWVD